METSNQQQIVPFLWFDSNAEEGVKLYTSAFQNSGVHDLLRYDEESAKVSGQPKDSVLTVSFQLNGQEFVALNGGPVFKFNPAISFYVNCQTEDQADHLWNQFLAGGTVLMELKTYPFSKKFGWIRDQFGLSWQLNFTGSEQKISPCLMFTGPQAGRAEEAINFYISLFKNSALNLVARYEKGEEGAEGKVKHASFTLAGETFIAMDSHLEHSFSFTPAVSFTVYCQTQQEVDYFWVHLSEGGKEVECGWLEDKFGVSWQIVPRILNQLLGGPDRKKAKRAMHAMLSMKKLDIRALEEA